MGQREQEIKRILNKGRYGFTNDEDCISWALSTIPELLDRVEELEKELTKKDYTIFSVKSKLVDIQNVILKESDTTE